MKENKELRVVFVSPRYVFRYTLDALIREMAAETGNGIGVINDELAQLAGVKGKTIRNWRKEKIQSSAGKNAVGRNYTFNQDVRKKFAMYFNIAAEDLDTATVRRKAKETSQAA